MGPRLFSRGNEISPPADGAVTAASMGPRLFSRGNPEARSGQYPAKTASMGPRLFSRGNHLAERRIKYLNRASMGPRLFSRGNGSGWGAGGQGDELQWGHDFSAVEILLALVGPALGATGFNGATTFQPWKYFFRFVSGCDHNPASMGPRLFSRGNRVGHRDQR